MNSDSDFLRLDPDPAVKWATVSVDGISFQAPSGGNLAAAMLAAGYRWFRQSGVDGGHRGPWCMMGACYECMVEVDGVARQACMTLVTDGMQVSRPGPIESKPGGRR